MGSGESGPHAKPGLEPASKTGERAEVVVGEGNTSQRRGLDRGGAQSEKLVKK